MTPEAEPYMDSAPMLSSIVDEVGSGFAIGSIVGFGYYFLKGSPGGGRLRAAALKAPRVGGLGVGLTLLWFGVSNGLASLRNRSDPFNSFCAGAVTGAAARASRGVAAASLAAVCLGGVVATVDVLAADTRKLEAGLDWRPNGPPGCATDEFALLELTRKARSAAAKKADASH